MNKNDGGPAFPAKKFAEPGYNGQVFYSYPTGMSLRDWFAGMVSYQEVDLLAENEGISHQKARYILADRLIEEREK